MWDEWVVDLPRLTTLTAIRSTFDGGEGYNTFQYPRCVTLESPCNQRGVSRRHALCHRRGSPSLLWVLRWRSSEQLLCVSRITTRCGSGSDAVVLGLFVRRSRRFIECMCWVTTQVLKGLFEERQAIHSTARSVFVIGIRREVALFKGANSYEWGKRRSETSKDSYIILVVKSTRKSDCCKRRHV